MNRLQRLWDVTKQMDDVLNTDVTGDNRDKIMEQINDLLARREKLLNQVKPPFNEGEQELGNKVVNLNKQVQEKMDTVFNALKTEMKQVKKQKKSNRSYINPYENVKTVDGMYMDSKN